MHASCPVSAQRLMVDSATSKRTATSAVESQVVGGMDVMSDIIDITDLNI